MGHDPYLQFLLLIALLYFVPKLLVPLGLPSPLGEMALGVALGPLALALMPMDATIEQLARLGVAALFLFAGLEVDLAELAQRRRTLLEHVLLQVVLIAGAAWLLHHFGLSTMVSLTVAAAALSSSASFILPAVELMPIDADVRTWVKQKAIATELLAILVVLVGANSASWGQLARGLAFVAGVVAAVPLAFALFQRTLLRWAPHSEASLVMIIGLFAAYASHAAGVHDLVGAFVAGVAARRSLRWCEQHGLQVRGVESALDSFRFFAAFLMPFFFFATGLRLPASAFGREALLFAGALLLACVPPRVLVTMLHRRVRVHERWSVSFNVALLITPTLVFALAVAEILRARGVAEDWLLGGLAIYGAATCFLPLLRRRHPALAPAPALETPTEA